MKVKELIEILQGLDQEKEIVMTTVNKNGDIDINAIEAVQEDKEVGYYIW